MFLLNPLVSAEAKRFWDTSLRPDVLGRVGEWLKPADCKSAAPCGLRRFESFPVHQALSEQNSFAARASSLETAGQPHELFKGGLNFGVRAEGVKCAAAIAFSAVLHRGNGLGLGSSVGRARPW